MEVLPVSFISDILSLDAEIFGFLQKEQQDAKLKENYESRYELD